MRQEGSYVRHTEKTTGQEKAVKLTMGGRIKGQSLTNVLREKPQEKGNGTQLLQ